jgi:hydroxymethylglutaryl-CoA synthase
LAQLLAYGAYIPRYRLNRSAIASALRTGGDRGWRAVASFDQDSTSMAVEAARQAFRRTDVRPLATYLATTSPAYLDKTNACVVNAALGLDPSALVMDVAASVRGGAGALIAANDAPRPTLAVLSDVRGGLPGSADERDGGDAAAAFLFGSGPGIAEVIGIGSATTEFLDRWRLPGEFGSRSWEDRFGESVYLPLAHAALTDALKAGGMSPQDVRHMVITGTNPRAVARFAREAGVAGEVTTDASVGIGNAGTAQLGLLLADVLDRAGPEEVIAVTLLADGATTLLLRTTPALAERRDPAPGATVRALAAAGDDGLDYTTYLTWRGLLNREPPRRPDPAAPAAPPSYRNETWKYHLVASQCEACGTRHLPPVRACVSCGQVDRMSAVPMADIRATVTTFVVDKLAYTPSPPLVAVVLDFDGGGRLRCQLADADEGSLVVGDRVEMTFRRMTTSRGIHNYFWKARPVPSDANRS